MNESHNQPTDVPGTSPDVPRTSVDVPRTSVDVPDLSADEILARVLHRDGLMLVIDKPCGLPVHRGPKGGANLESSFDALRFGLPRPPGLAHRLHRRPSRTLLAGRHC